MIISDTRTSVSHMEALISAEEKMVSEVEIIISATDTVFLKADTAFAVLDRHLLTKAGQFSVRTHIKQLIGVAIQLRRRKL